MNAHPSATITHPWIIALRERLDDLEHALLQGDASAVEQASSGVQSTLQGAPKTAEFGIIGSTLRADMQAAAIRFGQLRQAVIRGNAHGQRALNSLFPQKAKPTYVGMAGAASSSTGGAGRSFLSA
jgi:hypothetical protein